MDVMHPRCAGLDLGKDSLVASVRIASGNSVQQEVREFGTTTKELLSLADWLISHEVTHVAMEATGTYWKPVWHILEGSFDLVLANAAHIRNVPGRKTDVNDAMWIADLLAHGLIRSSFVPPAPVQELRDLTRTRKQLVREIAQHTQRIQKVLDSANLKVVGVVSEILGATGRAILKALIEGETDPNRLADLARGTLKKKRAQLVEALHGRVTSHHRGLLKLHLDVIESLEKAVATLDGQIGGAMEPFRTGVKYVTTVPGIANVSAQVVVSEIGVDMSRFPTHQHLISWATLCPRMDESAGKRKSTRIRKGGSWLKTVLVQCAWSAVRCKGTYFRAQFLRLKARRGPKKAIIAVAASMLTAIYYILRDGVAYKDLGPDYFDRRDAGKLTRRLVRKLQELGHKVHLEAGVAA